MFRTLPTYPSQFITITQIPSSSSLTVHINCTKILSHGRPAIGLLLLKLHIYRCIAQVAECKKFHEVLAHVEGFFLGYRDLIMNGKKGLKDVFVQANTACVDDGVGVELREYEASARG